MSVELTPVRRRMRRGFLDLIWITVGSVQKGSQAPFR